MKHEYNGDMFMKREHAETRWNKREGGQMFRNLYAEEARHNQTNITMGKMLEINPVTYSRKKKAQAPSFFICLSFNFRSNKPRLFPVLPRVHRRGKPA